MLHELSRSALSYDLVTFKVIYLLLFQMGLFSCAADDKILTGLYRASRGPSARAKLLVVTSGHPSTQWEGETAVMFHVSTAVCQ